MKNLKDFVKQAAVIMLVEVVVIGILSFGLDRYFLRLIDSWTLWQYLLLIAVLAAVAVVSYFIWQGFGKLRSKRRETKMKQKIENFQLSVMQEFFRIRMEQSYRNAWPAQVQAVVDAKYQNNDPHKTNYQLVRNALDNEGVETLDEKDLDITCISALMLYDFYSQCRVGSAFAQQIRNIRKDKNMLTSHRPDPNDLLSVNILELTMLKNLRSFLTALQMSNWFYADKAQFIQKHLDTIDMLTQELFQSMAQADQEKVDLESSCRSYLNRLMEERAANAGEYLPLSYKASDGSAQRFSLEDLKKNQQGFVLFADAGYGKTWSLQELAGQCAVEAMQSAKEHRVIPILVKMGPLAVHSEPILKAVQEYLFPGSEQLEKTRQFLQNERVILFVDGMDEADPENKDHARDELIRLSQNARHLRIVGGTRGSDVKAFPPELPKYMICDLTDGQAKQFMKKLISNPEQYQKAVFTYFENEETAFLRNLRSPFYLKCYIDFVLGGETNPISDTDMMIRCMERMIQREINIKGFSATVEIINAFLRKLAKMQGDRPYVPVTTALEEIGKAWPYQDKSIASLFQIKDTLVELQILREVSNGYQDSMLCFWHQKYKELYSPVALDMASWLY